MRWAPVHPRGQAVPLLQEHCIASCSGQSAQSKKKYSIIISICTVNCTYNMTKFFSIFLKWIFFWVTLSLTHWLTNLRYPQDVTSSGLIVCNASEGPSELGALESEKPFRKDNNSDRNYKANYNFLRVAFEYVCFCVCIWIRLVLCLFVCVWK